MVFRSQFLYPFLLAAAMVVLLACLNWQCLLLAFLVGGIGWGLWAIVGSPGSYKPAGRPHKRDKTTALARGSQTTVPTSESKPDDAVPSDKSRLYHFPNRSRLATK